MNRQAEANNSQNGMSLVELLVAITIIVIITTPVLQMTTQMLKMYRSIRGTVDMVQNASFGFSRMAREISTAYWHGPITVTGNAPRFIIDDDGVYAGANDRLSWNATTYNSNEGDNPLVLDGIDMVELGLAKQYHTGQKIYYLGLRKQTQSTAGDIPDGDVKTGGTVDIGDAIVFNLDYVRFQALDGTAIPLTKSSSWDYTGSGASTLPKLVRVTLNIEDPTGAAPDLLISADIGTMR